MAGSTIARQTVRENGTCHALSNKQMLTIYLMLTSSLMPTT